MLVSADEITTFASGQFDRARSFSSQIPFIEKSLQTERFTKEAQSIRASICDDAEVRDLQLSDGLAVWTSVLSVDIRDSTALADMVAPRDMYLVVHTLLPTLAFICEKFQGEVMNFRGDGLFAAFGRTKIADDGVEPSSKDKGRSNQMSVACGLALLEAVPSAIQLVLERNGISVELSIGVGVDCGRATVTRIGWMNAGEHTAYGSCVNHACHLASGTNQLIVSGNVKSAFPSSENGKVTFVDVAKGYSVSFSEPIIP